MLTIFDCDGVLVDSEVIALDTLSAMMTEYGQPMSVAACGEAFLGRHNDDFIRGIERRLGRALPAGEAGRMRARMIERLKRELKPVPGTAAALARLDGPRCVASSSDRERITLTLRLTGLEGYFGEDIFSGLDVAHSKPAPDLFLHAARSMRVAASDCVVVEDSVFGVQAGIAAGMRVVGFTGGGHSDSGHAARLREAGADMIVGAMADLPAALLEAEPG